MENRTKFKAVIYNGLIYFIITIIKHSKESNSDLNFTWNIKLLLLAYYGFPNKIEIGIKHAI